MLLPSAIAAACGVAEDPARDAADHLVGELRDRSLTLVLDGCEAITDSVRTMIDRLLGACPNVRVVCTSLQPIGLPDEMQLVLTGLPHGMKSGDSPSDGVRLFVDRARSRGADPDKLEDRIELVRKIVQALDGIPLAIGLAAGRSQTSSLEEILAGVVAGDDPLNSRPVGAPVRHSSLRAALEWTLSQLPSEHRETLAELSLLPGPFTKGTAAAVASAPVLDLELQLDALMTTPCCTRRSARPSPRCALPRPGRRSWRPGPGSSSSCAITRQRW